MASKTRSSTHFLNQRAQAAVYQQTGDKWSIAMHTQHVLAELRQMVYASSMLEDAIKEDKGVRP